MALLAPISAGELIDKITILRIKARRIAADRRANVQHELGLLEILAERELAGIDLAALTAELTAINEGLWDIEDAKRGCERRGDFGPAFVALARSVYIENDRRAAVKRRINDAAGSDIVEQKSYTPYSDGNS